MKRRNFLRTSTAATLAFGSARSLIAAESKNTYQKNIGIQLYTLRAELATDAPGTLKQVAEAGYKQVELYGFPDADVMIAGAKNVGLAIHSAHFQWNSVVNPKDKEMSEFSKILEKAHDRSLSHLVIPYLTDADRKTLDRYKQIAENANRAAAMAKKASIRLSYHNHSFEFQPIEGGTTGYDVFTSEFSPDMGFEIDVFWVKVAGVDPVELIKKLGRRVTQLHLKDLKDSIALPNYGSLPDDAYQELGDGIIPMVPILSAAEAAGVEHCHVEQDHSPNALASIRQSIEYLRKQ